MSSEFQLELPSQCITLLCRMSKNFENKYKWPFQTRPHSHQKRDRVAVRSCDMTPCPALHIRATAHTILFSASAIESLFRSSTQISIPIPRPNGESLNHAMLILRLNAESRQNATTKSPMLKVVYLPWSFNVCDSVLSERVWFRHDASALGGETVRPLRRAPYYFAPWSKSFEKTMSISDLFEWWFLYIVGLRDWRRICQRPIWSLDRDLKGKNKEFLSIGAQSCQVSQHAV